MGNKQEKRDSPGDQMVLIGERREKPKCPCHEVIGWIGLIIKNVIDS